MLPSLTRSGSSTSVHRTTPYPSNIYLVRPTNPIAPSSIVVGNGSILPVTSVGDMVLPSPFYLNNILVAPDIIRNLLSICQFTTNK
jgi:hypothetical protein